MAPSPLTTTQFTTAYAAAAKISCCRSDGEYGALSLSPGSTNLLEYVKNHAVCSSGGTRRFGNRRLASAPSVALVQPTTRKTISRVVPCRCRGGNPAVDPSPLLLATHADPAGTTASTGVCGYLPGQVGIFSVASTSAAAAGSTADTGGDAALAHAGARGDDDLGYEATPVTSQPQLRDERRSGAGMSDLV